MRAPLPSEQNRSPNSPVETDAYRPSPALRRSPTLLTPASAIGCLAQGRGILRGNANRMAALLRQCRVVDHQNGVVTADKPVRLNKKFRFQRCRIPHASRGKMMQLIVLAGDQPLRHRLNALPLARSDQSRNVEWAHPSPGLVRQAGQKWLQPALKLRGPTELRAHRDRPPKSRSLRNHRLADLGIPKSDAITHNLPK